MSRPSPGRIRLPRRGVAVLLRLAHPEPAEFVLGASQRPTVRFRIGGSGCLDMGKVSREQGDPAFKEGPASGQF